MLFEGKIKLLSPLSHNSDETFGTDVFFRKYNIVNHLNEIVAIPFLSGNSIRGVMRRLIADDFLKLVGLEKIPDRLFYIFFSGGLLEKGEDTYQIQIIKDIRETIPFISLFGSAFSNKMIRGKMKVGLGQLICADTCEYTGEKSDKRYYDFLEEVFYTRKNSLEDKTEAITTQMKYSAETLIAGSELKHSFYLEDCNNVEISCFFRAISILKNKPFLGGKSGIGHGHIYLDYDFSSLSDQEYLEYIQSKKDYIKAFCLNVIS